MTAYINCTSMLSRYHCNRKVRDWLKTNRAQEHIQELSRRLRLSKNAIVKVAKGGSSPGTEIHPALESAFVKWIKRLPSLKPEEQEQFKLQALIGGQMEVDVEAGRADLVTDDSVYEVKRARSWKAALGQVIAYTTFNNKTPVIALFDHAHMKQKKKDTIQCVCERVGVQVRYL